jgi:transcription elongation factor GreA
MKISAQKLIEIKKEIENKKRYLKHELEEGVKRGGPMDSFKEAAAVSANLQAHNQKLKELENMLKDVQELPDEVPGDEIILGKWFEIESDTGRKRYRLVESIESNISNNLLSIESPLGKAVLGKKEGTEININNNVMKILIVE